MTGMRFGRLTVLRRAENNSAGRARWLCRCDCGELCVTAGRNLRSGYTKSCGCAKREAFYNRRDLTGMRFGRLTVLRPGESKKRNRTAGALWLCRCDCGKETEAAAACLLSGRTRSCGCLNREQMGRMHEHMHYRDDTCLEILRRSCEDTGRNKSGFRGLYRLPSGKYRASITFQGKHYDLGHYASFDQAVQARLDAEETLHRGYIKALQDYEEMAKSDPAWAEANPFFYQVTRADGGFQVYTNAVAATV